MNTEAYDKAFVDENMMGPNSLRIAQELLQAVPLTPGMRVLDLGCGRGLTSVFLAREYGVQVFAADLWISATDNYARFRERGVADLVVPIHADAHDLPFADGYFDAVVSVDAYHYFGNNDSYFDTYLRPLLKQDGMVALAFPGMKREVLADIPADMKNLWPPEALPMWRSRPWWEERLGKSLCGMRIWEMTCFDDAWRDWLATDNPYAIGDRAMMAADAGRYMNLIALTGHIA